MNLFRLALVALVSTTIGSARAVEWKTYTRDQQSPIVLKKPMPGINPDAALKTLRDSGYDLHNDWIDVADTWIGHNPACYVMMGTPSSASVSFIQIHTTGGTPRAVVERVCLPEMRAVLALAFPGWDTRDIWLRQAFAIPKGASTTRNGLYLSYYVTGGGDGGTEYVSLMLSAE